MTSIPMKVPWKTLERMLGVALQKLGHQVRGAVYDCYQGGQEDINTAFFVSTQEEGSSVQLGCPGMYSSDMELFSLNPYLLYPYQDQLSEYLMPALLLCARPLSVAGSYRLMLRKVNSLTISSSNSSPRTTRRKSSTSSPSLS